MEIKYISINGGAIKPYEKNPRYNKNAIEYVAKSIESYGFKNPIILDKNGVIIAGHTRYEAAKLLGLENVPCIIADDLSEEQVRAFRIADNKVSDYSIWDNKLLIEELEIIGEDFFTGFDFGDILNFDVLNEDDNSIIEDNENGVTYEIVFRSENKDKIEKIKTMWETIENE